MRGRKSKLDMSTEAGRMLFWDLLNFKKSGINPMDTDQVKSEAFCKKRPEFQLVSFGGFKEQALSMASVAISQLPNKEKRECEAMAKAARKARSDKRRKSRQQANANVVANQPTLKKAPNPSHRATGLHDTIVAACPNKEKAMVMFEPEGTTKDPSSNKLEFSTDGNCLLKHVRIPRSWRSGAKLIGGSRKMEPTDGDIVIVNEAIENRLEGTEEDDEGDLWELRELITLPFACHRRLFDKHGGLMDSCLTQTNENGCTWAHFWLIASNVELKPTQASTRILAQLEDSSDSDSDQHGMDEDSSSEDEEENETKKFPSTSQETTAEWASTSEQKKVLEELTNSNQQERERLAEEAKALSSERRKQEAELDKEKTTIMEQRKFLQEQAKKNDETAARCAKEKEKLAAERRKTEQNKNIEKTAIRQQHKKTSEDMEAQAKSLQDLMKQHESERLHVETEKRNVETTRLDIKTELRKIEEEKRNMEAERRNPETERRNIDAERHSVNIKLDELACEKNRIKDVVEKRERKAANSIETERKKLEQHQMQLASQQKEMEQRRAQEEEQRRNELRKLQEEQHSFLEEKKEAESRMEQQLAAHQKQMEEEQARLQAEQEKMLEEKQKITQEQKQIDEAIRAEDPNPNPRKRRRRSELPPEPSRKSTRIRIRVTRKKKEQSAIVLWFGFIVKKGRQF